MSLSYSYTAAPEAGLCHCPHCTEALEAQRGKATQLVSGERDLPHAPPPVQAPGLDVPSSLRPRTELGRAAKPPLRCQSVRPATPHPLKLAPAAPSIPEEGRLVPCLLLPAGRARAYTPHTQISLWGPPHQQVKVPATSLVFWLCMWPFPGVTPPLPGQALPLPPCPPPPFTRDRRKAFPSWGPSGPIRIASSS